jgi:hypothetical protein
LDIAALGPDPLGVSQVGDFYGSGAWAGWILTICASWYSFLGGDKAKIDPNVWLFLPGLNWAAIDAGGEVESIAQ